MKPDIQIFKDNQGVAEAFAKYLYELIQGKEKISIALSGGSTPKVLFRHLAQYYVDKIDWTKVHFFWGDERCVPSDHEESNFHTTATLLLQYIDIPEENIHPVIGEGIPDFEAIRYGEEIVSSLELKNDLPVFDLIILGMGADGHTASIFPHQMKLLSSKEICAVAEHPESGQKRITLTGPVINQAKEIAFLVTGNSKAEKINEILSRERNWADYPAAHIQPTNGKLIWFLDKAAVASYILSNAITK